MEGLIFVILRYITALKQNIENIQRFDDCLNILSCFHFFNPETVQNFTTKGSLLLECLQITIIKTVDAKSKKLKSCFLNKNKFKFDLLKWKSHMPHPVRMDFTKTPSNEVRVWLLFP